MKELLFLLVLFVSNVIQAITGFAGTVLAMPPSVYLLGLDHAKVVLNVMAWLSGLMIAVTGYRHINWKELLKMSAVMLVGMFAGIQICRIVKSENILLTEYSRAMKSHFRKFGNQMSGSGNHLCNYASLLA